MTQIALRGLQYAGQIDEDLEQLLFGFMRDHHPLRTRQEAVTTLSRLPSAPHIVERIRSEILEHEAYAHRLDEMYVAAAKGFISYLPGEDALRLLSEKLAIPEAAEYKVELCRALTSVKVSFDRLLETLVEFLEHGNDWGARGGAALALGLLKHDRERIARILTDRLESETDIGVRLRLTDALGHLGWHDRQIDNALRNTLQEEHHFHTRWKLIEAYALLTRKEEFIREQIVQPVLNAAIDEKNRRQAFEILCQVEYYTDSLMHDIIQQLPAFSAPLSKSALAYLAAVPSIHEHDRSALQAYLQRVIHDDMADSVLRNRAFETLYTIYDLLSVQ